MATIYEVILLLVEIQIFTVSGALAPGPLSMATLGAGLKRGWRAGLYAATGHLIVELPIFFSIAVGLLTIESIVEIESVLLGIGGSYLIYIGYTQARMSDVEFRALEEARHPILIGMMFSLFNPYFILWWVALGSVFIYDSIKLLGFYSLPLVYVAHVWMDYAWLTLLSFIAGEGATRFGGRLIRYVNIVLGLLLIGMGISFLLSALNTVPL